MPSRTTAFPVRRRRGRRPGAAARLWGGGGGCRVEALEPRFLLAADAGGPVWPLDRSALSFAERGSVAAPEVEAAADADVPLVLSDYRVSHDGDAAAADGSAARSIPEQKGAHDTPADAQMLPGDTATDVLGSLTADGPLSVFRVPLDVDRSPMLLVGMAWDTPDAAVAGRLRILDGAGDLLLEEALSSGPLEVDLDFDPADDGPGAALVIELVPAPGAAAAADFTLSLRPSASWAVSPETSLAAVDFSDSVGPLSQSIVPSTPLAPTTGASAVTGDSLPPPSLPTPAQTPAAPDLGAAPPPPESTAPSPAGRVVLPLPQASTPAAAGIFLTPLTLNPTARQVVAVVADPTLLDPVPAAPGVSSAPLADAERPAAPPPGAQAVGEIEPPWLGPPATPEVETAAYTAPEPARPRLVLGLPPVGVPGLERPVRPPALARCESAGATLPRRLDEPPVVTCGGHPQAVAAADPPPARRPRTALAVLYGSVCSVLGVTAPDWAHALRRTARGARDDGTAGDA